MTAISLAAVLGVSWLGVLWHFLGAILVLVCILLTVVILIQDSKGAGLTSAFGAGPGESLLGARMQKDVARWTVYLTSVFAVLVIAMGLIGTYRLTHETAGAAGAKAPSARAEGQPPALPGGDAPSELPPLEPSTTPPSPTGGASAPSPVPAPAASEGKTAEAPAPVPVPVPAPAPAVPAVPGTQPESPR